MEHQPYQPADPPPAPDRPDDGEESRPASAHSQPEPDRWTELSADNPLGESRLPMDPTSPPEPGHRPGQPTPPLAEYPPHRPSPNPTFPSESDHRAAAAAPPDDPDDRRTATGAGDHTGFSPPPGPPFDAGLRFDWDLIEQLADDPRPAAASRARTPWRVITAVALLTALLTAAAGTALLWRMGAFDQPPPAERSTANYIIASPPAPAAQDVEGASGELLDLPLDEGDQSETDGPPDRSPSTAPAPPVVVTAAPVNTVAQVAEQVIPSITSVYNYAAEEDIDPSSSGSGVIFNTDGYLLTNHHVIDEAAALRVILHNGRSLPAEVIGSDPLMDIAVLRVDWPDLHPVEFADINTARIGDPTVAIGNPLGLDGGPSVTSGVISAFDRTLQVDPFTGAQLYGLLQTDTPITRGSSGGALLNRDGQLLGITAAIGVSDVGAEGIGFAVPIHLVIGIIDDLLADGEVRHAFLGIEGSPAFDEDDNGVMTPIGVEVNRLLDGSGFGTAGGQAGDVITALDDQSVRSMTLLVARLRGYRAGGEVKVNVLRDGETMELSVTLGQYPQQDDS